MPVKTSSGLRYSDVTPRRVYLERRKFLASLPAAFLAGRELLTPWARAAEEILADLAQQG